LVSIAQEIPSEWDGERRDLDCLVNLLLERRRAVRHLIADFRASLRNPFPNWNTDHTQELATAICATG
jgi:hypothetical protein